MIQYGVAVLEKDLAILCELRLVLNHPGGSEPINITLTEYQAPQLIPRCNKAGVSAQFASILEQ
jgi:hypothetical protein